MVINWWNLDVFTDFKYSQTQQDFDACPIQETAKKLASAQFMTDVIQKT